MIYVTCTQIIKVGFGSEVFHGKGVRDVRMRHVSIKQLCFQVKNLNRRAGLRGAFMEDL